jgi:hypothetical protein
MSSNRSLKLGTFPVFLLFPLTFSQIWFILVVGLLVHLLDKIENKNPGLNVIQNTQKYFLWHLVIFVRKKEYFDRIFPFKLYFSHSSEISHPKNAACVVKKEQKKTCVASSGQKAITEQYLQKLEIPKFFGLLLNIVNHRILSLNQCWSPNLTFPSLKPTPQTSLQIMKVPV